ncbi:putative Aspartate--tRNA ligase [Candidatus Sulfopaludibacter sp. SbA4]|nr:putative Aspartate--tRNA ligase [Candidatus Sulfopaludibacter sp. SbA4]
MEPSAVALDFLGELRRTHSCGVLRAADEGQTVVLMGWVHRRRDHGGVVFIDLRDRDGITQVVVHEDADPAVHGRAEQVRPEYVIAVEGKVAPRGPVAVNPNLATGEIEVVASKVWILNESRTPPFPMEEQVDVAEDVRLKYRYVDLRRPHMQRNIILRSKISFAVRETLYAQGFLEIETPFMTRSTPEGARDYLVPSRVQPGSFYALPQSPQIFKQLLMVSGFEKYFQIVRCFRDEDFRADRQAEFTQIDLEMSFPQQERVFEVIEPLVQRVCRSHRAAGSARVRSGGPPRGDAVSTHDLCPGDAQLRHRQTRSPNSAHAPGGGSGAGTGQCWDAAGGDPHSRDRSAEPQGARRAEGFRPGTRPARVRRFQAPGTRLPRRDGQGARTLRDFF